MACLGFHLVLIFLVCARDTFWIFATTPTVFPRATERLWRGGQRTASAALGQLLSPSNPVRNGIAVYLDSAGIEAGYGFFAPNVPSNYKLVFEIHYAEGRIEYEVPKVGSAATGLRLCGLLDQIGDTTYEPLRQMMIKILTYSVWQERPDATMIRAVFGIDNLPSPEDFLKGENGSYQTLYRYDFTFRPPEEKNEHL